MQSADWNDIAIRLTGYALWRLRNLQWRRGVLDGVSATRSAEDIAGEAILKVLEGRRAWDPQRGPLLPYLRGVVDSLISHLGESPERGSKRLVADVDAVAVVEGKPAADDERIDALRGGLVEAGEHALLEIVDAVLADAEATPRALAQRLATSVADINNRLKRLRRFAQRQLSARIGGARRYETR